MKSVPMARALLTHMKKIGIAPSGLTVSPEGEISIGFKNSKMAESEDVSADQLLESWSASRGTKTKTKRAQISS